MSISPIAVSLGFPIALDVIGSGLKLARKSFNELLAAEESGQRDKQIEFEAASFPEIPSRGSERLESIAESVRTILEQNGIRLPYSIKIRDLGTAQPSLEIEGAESSRIAELLDNNPNLLNQLYDFVQSESVLTPLGFQGKSVVITNNITYQAQSL